MLIVTRNIQLHFSVIKSHHFLCMNVCMNVHQREKNLGDKLIANDLGIHR